MHDNAKRIGPLCSKCERPMTWHSAQPVRTRAGNEDIIQVFWCEECDRLTAVSEAGKAA